MRASKPAHMPDSTDQRDDELVDRIAHGDREAFAHLYRRYRPELYRFALHTCGSAASAEDVVQDAFVAVIQFASRYQTGRSGVLPWLLGIARNHARRCRSERSSLPLPQDEAQSPQSLIVDADPLAEVARQEHVTLLRRALLELPVKYREVVVLCDLHELTYGDAADALGCAVGTVRSRLHRGRALLAKRLGHSGQEMICRMPAARPIL
jgi:RNA polymerase sigma-70 factor, ECF subfamily